MNPDSETTRLAGLCRASPGDFQLIAYGAAPDQFGELWGAGGEEERPVAALIHGGYWRARYRLDVMHALAADLCSRGYAVWNLEYRRVGSGGGWPTTFADIARGLDLLADIADGFRLGSGRLITIGHSAGGQLALWSAARTQIGGSCGPPRTEPAHVVSLAGVCDLTQAADRRLSHDAVIGLLGGIPAEIPQIYARTCPRLLLPLGVDQTIVHGGADTDVPIEMSADYARAARAAGDRCSFIFRPEADHFDMIDPASPSWCAVADRLDTIFAPRRG